MIRALQENRQGLPFHFLDNVDPAGMSRLYDDLGDRLKTTLVIVVSKSGGTPEPHLGMIQSRDRLERLGCRWSQHAVAVTMKDSKLDQEAAAEGWLNRFDMFDWVAAAPPSPALWVCCLLFWLALIAMPSFAAPP